MNQHVLNLLVIGQQVEVRTCVYFNSDNGPVGFGLPNGFTNICMKYEMINYMRTNTWNHSTCYQVGLLQVN